VDQIKAPDLADPRFKAYPYPFYARLRNLVQKAFTPRLIDRLRERVQSVCDELLDAAAARGRMELVGGFALPLPITIIGELLGTSAQDRLRFHAWSRSMIGVSRSTDAVRALPRIWGHCAGERARSCAGWRRCRSFFRESR